MISDELAKGLRHWLIDATSSSPSSIAQNCGLCYYLDQNELIFEMQAFWTEAGLNLYYPFGSEQEFVKESTDGTCHLNPRRLSWVKERLEEYDRTLAIYEEEKRT